MYIYIHIYVYIYIHVYIYIYIHVYNLINLNLLEFLMHLDIQGLQNLLFKGQEFKWNKESYIGLIFTFWIS